MSSRDDDTDKRQRTVAELLAQHGDTPQQGDEAQRGRRRRAEDAAEETAPQAIIERVRGGTGTNLSPAGHSVNGHPKPADQQPQQPEQRQQPGNQAQEQNRRAAQAQSQAQTQQHPPVQPPQPQAPQQPQPPQGQQGQQTQQNQGPAVPARRSGEGTSQTKSPTRTIPPIGEPEMASDGFPEPPEYDDYSDPAKYNPPPPLPDDAPKPQRGSLTARLAGAPPEPLTQQMQAVSDDDKQLERPSAMEQTGFYKPNFDEEQDEDEELPGEQAGYHQSLDEDEYADEDYAEDEYLDEDEYADYEDEDYEDEPRGAREWLTLLGLIAAGVVGGGLVWLAFDWLWSTSKLVAAVGVVVVTLAIVFLVRKAWRARDVQTTVFSVIVGLIVTATPAALQYLGS